MRRDVFRYRGGKNGHNDMSLSIREPTVVGFLCAGGGAFFRKINDASDGNLLTKQRG